MQSAGHSKPGYGSFCDLLNTLGAESSEHLETFMQEMYS